jgi:hypothetical protein
MDYMASNDRFYQLELRHRPALHGDIGSLLKIQGLVIAGEGAMATLLLPDAPMGILYSPCYELTIEEWTDFLQRSDNPELLMPGKAFHRKVRYEISGAVQQKVWKSDGLKCMYCGAIMGDVQLTVDHFVPLEIGGKNDTSNYLAACRRCNKNKGAQDPKEFCKTTRHGYDFYVEYLAERIIK